jgi:preprotein translocase SecE subunit
VAFQIYKAGQGRYVRVPTAIGMAIVAGVLVYYVGLMLFRYIDNDFSAKPYLVYGIPALIAIGFFVLGVLLLNKTSFVDFLIATESEMKKVSWSGRSELVGSTIVVIATVILLAIVIYCFDHVYIWLLTHGLGLW